MAVSVALSLPEIRPPLLQHTDRPAWLVMPAKAVVPIRGTACPCDPRPSCRG